MPVVWMEGRGPGSQTPDGQASGFPYEPGRKSLPEMQEHCNRKDKSPPPE